MLDIFRTDAFGVVPMTAAINKAPYKPGRIGQLGLFRESGIRTTVVAVEIRDGQLTLIQTSPRGGIGSSIGTTPRTVRAFSVPHLERNGFVNADEVQNVRAFGTEDALLGVQTVVNERLATLRAMHEVTLEHMRAGAIQGLILDADGSTLFDLFAEFGVTQQTAVISPNTAADDGDALRAEIVAAQRLIEDVLGAEPVSGWRAFAGAGFIDALRADTAVVQTLRYSDPLALLQTDASANRLFRFGGVAFEEYRGSIAPGPTAASPTPSRVPFFASDEAYMFPEGSDIFRTYFAPADFVEAVNTPGLPVYAKQEVTKFERGVELHTQSNPLVLCLRPDAVIKLTLAT